jgi:hypothetical protein
METFDLGWLLGENVRKRRNIGIVIFSLILIWFWGKNYHNLLKFSY